MTSKSGPHSTEATDERDPRRPLTEQERLVDDVERVRHEQGDEVPDAENERIVEDLRELHDEMAEGHDPTTSREAFEQQAAQLDVSEEAGEVGDR